MEIKWADITDMKYSLDNNKNWHTSKDKLNAMYYGHWIILAIFYKNEVYYWWYPNKDILLNEKQNKNCVPCTIAREQ